ncbi:5'-AMP-activated protein kinase beta subunit, interation domain-containing protein [Zopfochytrium polystomum]|nr:5'-AMP-activated protein kinase beta subunit, interation domain-containing protein [Zopfochytrium polystomum]
MLSWTGGGRTVHVTGTFNNWRQKIRLTKSKTDFTTVVDMPAGTTHRFKFIVDDEWKCSEDLPMATDSEGNLVNYLDVMDEKGDTMGDGLDGLSYEAGPSTLSESPPSTYTSKIPGYLNWHLQPPPTSLTGVAASFRPEPPPLPNEPPPPHLPPHLERVLLNAPQADIGSRDDNTVLGLPHPVTINHLYACRIRDGVMALASTTRYRSKYVTTILYKPVAV